MKHPRPLLAVVAIAVMVLGPTGCSGNPSYEAPSDVPTPTAATVPGGPEVAPVPEGYVQVFADGFNGTEVDTSVWSVEDDSTFGSGNKEIALLNSENVTVADGTLTISALPMDAPETRDDITYEYTSGMLQTKGKQAWQYGRFEVRSKMSLVPGNSAGLLPAFWMRPEDGGLGEIDVLEVNGSGDVAKPLELNAAVHYDYDKSTEPGHVESKSALESTDQWHVYAVDWEPESITWYVDDVQVAQRTAADLEWLTEAFSRDASFFLRLNMAVGGNWPGHPTSATAFPATFQADWVRVLQRDSTSPAPAPGATATHRSTPAPAR